MLSVVAFHAFPNRIQGGFVGVDIFFVISGYLISTIIFEDLDRGTFSFSEFYVRRIKRIFPALILVLIAGYAFGWFALLADEYRQLGKHIAAGAGFASNFALWGEAGYFDNAAETKPLLHLWSLGIEEQFYIVWPALLWLAWKNKIRFLSASIAVAIGSFCLNVAGTGSDIVAAFYSPQTRFWELLSGGMLAAASFEKRRGLVQEPDEKSPSDVLSFVGLALVACGFWTINKGVYFPGAWALVPVSGAVVLISAGPQAWVNRVVLSNRGAVWFGLISYPLYLWHWPLLSFARIVEGQPIGPSFRIAAVALSIALAWLTYALVEKRIRLGGHGKAKAAGLLGLMAVVGVVGCITYSEGGLPNRRALAKIGENAAIFRWFGEDEPAAHSECLGRYALSGPIRYCNVSGAGKPSIAIIGDSHGRALFAGLKDVLKERNEGLLQIGGRLFLDVATYPEGDPGEIEVYKGGIKATEFAAQEPSIKKVVMVSRGPRYLAGDWQFKLISDPNLKDHMKIWNIAMRKTLDSFVKRNKEVIFVLENPETGFDPRSCLEGRPLRFSDRVRNPCAVPRADFERRHHAYRTLVREILADYPKVKLFDSAAPLCDEQLCWAMKDGKLLYLDDHHLSSEGARVVSAELVKLFD